MGPRPLGLGGNGVDPAIVLRLKLSYILDGEYVEIAGIKNIMVKGPLRFGVSLTHCPSTEALLY